MTPEETSEALAKIGNGLGYLGRAAPGIAKATIGAGARELAKFMRSAAPLGPVRKVNGQTIKPGALRASIRGRATKTVDGVATAKAGIEVGQKPGKGSAPHAHLVAAGTADRKTGGKGIYQGKKKPRKRILTGGRELNRGRVVARPFIRTATAGAQGQVFQVMVNTATRLIAKAIEKIGD